MTTDTPSSKPGLIRYTTPEWIRAFSTGKGAGVEDLGFDIKDLALPRQTHSDHIRWVKGSGRPEDTDAVITDVPGLCCCVKTADCIPILLWDSRQHIVAAVHAGWRGTVNCIVTKTISSMNAQPTDIHAIIGPGISQRSFEVGEEVFQTFEKAGFPMLKIARKYTEASHPEKWHIDLWEANRWLMMESGVKYIFVEGTCTMLSPLFYSARRESIQTGRNMNGIWIVP